MNPVLQHLAKDPQPWLQLRDLLQKAERDLPDTTHRPVLHGISGSVQDAKVQIRKQLLDAAHPHYEAILRASLQRVRGEGWPNLGPDEVFFLRENLLRAVDFVERIVVGEGKEKVTILEFPSQNLGEVMLWLLTDWWLDDGLHRMVQDATRDAIGKSKYYECGEN